MQGSGTTEARAESSRPERRRLRDGAREFGTPLAATFLGLLMVQSFRPDAAVAGETGPDGAAPGAATADPADLAGGSTAGNAPLHAFEPALSTTPIAAGSVLAVGTVIDPAALTRLAGSARFAEAAAPAAPAAGSAVALGETVAPGAVDLAAGGVSLELGLPSLPAASGEPIQTGDPDLANLGAYERGSDVDQTVTLTPKDDVYLGGDGDEHVIGLEGDDQLSGGGGDDWLEGGAGDDRLDGGTGNDVLDGGSGSDQLAGGSGDDLLTGGTGSDRLGGDTGSDILVLDDPTDTVKEMGLGADSGGNDTLVVKQSYADGLAKALPGLAPGGAATLVLGSPAVADFPTGLNAYRQQIDPDIENIRLEGTAAHDVVAGAGNNVIEGNLAANHLYGGAGNDQIHGAEGNDWLYGGAGDDWLEGGDGADLLYGGAGDDTFVLGLHESSDQIFDHEGRNSLRLSTGEAERVGIELRGSDLVVTYDERTLATVKDYVGHETSYAGIDLGDGLRSFDDFLNAGAESATMAAQAEDWLTGFMPEAADADPGPGATLGAAADLAVSSDGAVGAAAGFTGLDLTGGDDLWLPVDPTAEPGFDTTALAAQITVPEQPETGRDQERLAGS